MRLIITKLNFSFLILITLSIPFSHQLKKFITTEEKRLFNKFSSFVSSMSGLNLQTSAKSSTSLRIGAKNDFFAFVMNGIKNDLELNYLNYHTAVFNKDVDLELFPKVLTLNHGLDYIGNLKVRGVKQWNMFKEEDFSEKAEGWTNDKVSSCSGIEMMGGYCKLSKGETVKEFTDLPPHEQIRIQANFHFIDAWNGETGYMKLGQSEDNMNYFWTDSYNSFRSEGGINVCGGKWPEGKFSSPIDVVLNHTKDSIRISFGSTLDMDPCVESFGVSGIRIYVR